MLLAGYREGLNILEQTTGGACSNASHQLCGSTSVTVRMGWPTRAGGPHRCRHRR